MQVTRNTQLLVAAGMATIALAIAPSASADVSATSSVSANWAGYRATTQDGSGFTRVTGSWTEPSANCSSTAGHASFWVGLGGSSDGSGALEQAGTAVDCDDAGNATHSAWYELLPAPPVQLDLKVSPGDHMSASVDVHGSSVTITVSNATTGQHVTKTAAMTDTQPDVTSAEWIAEAPSQCDSSGGCEPLPLADFGKVGFTNATATSSGHTGTVSDSAWTAEPVTLSASNGTIDVSTGTTSGGAQPTSLSSDGSSFAVTYDGASSTSTTGGYDPAGSGYGYDPGTGGYGYDPGTGGYDDGAGAAGVVGAATPASLLAQLSARA